MQSILAAAFVLSGLVALPAFFVSGHRWRALERYLRSTHPGVWAGIAPPSGAEYSASSPGVRFVTQRRYRAVGDTHLDALGDQCLRSGYSALAAFLALIFSGLGYAALSA
jgi:hypothetical protein